MNPRIIAIGDIHGCTSALDAVLNACELQPDDTVIPLGDYIDRGPDSPGTIDRLIQLREQCNVFPLLGNHEDLLLDIIDGGMMNLQAWLDFGGQQTLKAYGAAMPTQIPIEHIEFMRSCHIWLQNDEHIFMHANYLELNDIDKQPREALIWESLRQRAPGPHKSGKRAVVGHTSQKNGEILNLGHLICIDTYCYGDGWLTALDIYSGQVWQADKFGRMRVHAG